MRLTRFLLLGAVLAMGGSTVGLVDAPSALAAGPGAVTFSYTGALQTWVVPADVTSITVDAQGGQGGTGAISPTAAGGLGGRAVATVAVNPGETLQIFVGGQGGAPTGANCSVATSGAAGFNGGGPGGPCGGGGGGGSDVRFTPYGTAQRLVTAGGGGGGSGSGLSAASGGVGGGTSGAAGGFVGSCPSTNGATASAGGTGNGDGTSGGLATGGAGGAAANGGGGGGGGLFGGGGGASIDQPTSGCASGGGGGSAGAAGSATGVSLTAGTRSGNGTVTISYETLVVAPATLPDETLGETYSQQFTATGGTGPYTFTFTDGTLPEGLALAADGTLSGAPRVAGTFTPTVTAQDSAGHQGSVSATFTVTDPAAAATTEPTDATAGPTLPATGPPGPVAEEALAGVAVAVLGSVCAEIGRRRRPSRSARPNA